MKLKLAVNKGCLNKTNPQDVARGWLNIQEPIEWLEGWVSAGYGWCATHFADRHRLTDNASGSNVIVIDIDGDTTLARFWSTDTARQWCAATYTSSSHSEEEHRFRALFPLGLELETVAQHRGAYWLVVNRLIADLGLEKLKDNCGQKPERLWFGNQNAEFTYNKEAEPVPDFLLQDIAYEDEVTFTSTEVTDLDVKRCQWLLREFLRPSEDGEYEDYFLPVMAACAGVGRALFDDWVDWVLRGHHGEKEENTKAFKWRGLGNYAGHTTLYSLAKKQDKNWTKSLPSHLRFGAVGTATGYTEFDPVPDFGDFITNKQGDTMNGAEEIHAEPLPDSSQVTTKRGRPKKSSDDAAKERASDVEKVKEILTDLRRNELTNAIEYTDAAGRTVVMEGNQLDLMTTKLSCENGVFIPEMRIKSAIQYAAGKNQYCPIRRYLDHCAAHAKPHEQWENIGEAFLGNKHRLATLAMQRMMVGAVARAYNPGCEMSWLPILVGAQGVGKSMFARSLVPQGLFSEVSTPLDTLMKEQYRLHVAWLLELPEIDNYFNTRKYREL